MKKNSYTNVWALLGLLLWAGPIWAQNQAPVPGTGPRRLSEDDFLYLTERLPSNADEMFWLFYPLGVTVDVATAYYLDAFEYGAPEVPLIPAEEQARIEKEAERRANEGSSETKEEWISRFRVIYVRTHPSYGGYQPGSTQRFYQLGYLGSRRALPTLRRVLEDTTRNLGDRALAAWAIAHCGSTAEGNYLEQWVWPMLPHGVMTEGELKEYGKSENSQALEHFVIALGRSGRSNLVTTFYMKSLVATRQALDNNSHFHSYLQHLEYKLKWAGNPVREYIEHVPYRDQSWPLPVKLEEHFWRRIDFRDRGNTRMTSYINSELDGLGSYELDLLFPRQSRQVNRSLWDEIHTSEAIAARIGKGKVTEDYYASKVGELEKDVLSHLFVAGDDIGVAYWPKFFFAPHKFPYISGPGSTGFASGQYQRGHFYPIYSRIWYWPLEFHKENWEWVQKNTHEDHQYRTITKHAIPFREFKITWRAEEKAVVGRRPWLPP